MLSLLKNEKAIFISLLTFIELIPFKHQTLHFSDGQSNVLEGAIHFIIFVVFIFVAFTGLIG